MRLISQPNEKILIQSKPEILRTFGDYVKTLRIRKCQITCEKMVKILNLCRNLKNFYIEMSKLEKLTLDGFRNLKWLANLLDDQNVKLKMLKIHGSKINDNFENVLKNYEQKLGKIVII